MSAPLLRILGLVAVSACLTAGCSEAKKIDVGGACILNSDCNSPLACAMGKCHDACHTSADCPVGQSCIIASDQSKVCQLPTETHCTYDSDCPTGLRCATDQRCRNQCQKDVDCPSGQTCTTTKTCAEPNQVDSNKNLFPPDGGVRGSGGASGGGGTGSCPMGDEGCSCYLNGTCNTGLTCASRLCTSFGAGGGAGGTSSAGGTVNTGGDRATSGTASTGGTMIGGGTGGSSAVGGASTAGGTTSAGGMLNAGGSRATGGIASTGGTTSTGGRTGVAGAIATGGAPPTGGASAFGGATKPDGSADAGGCPTGAATCLCYPGDTCDTGLSCVSGVCVRSATGGANGAGGTSSTGGIVNTGGTTATGGIASTGGATSSVQDAGPDGPVTPDATNGAGGANGAAADSGGFDGQSDDRRTSIESDSADVSSGTVADSAGIPFDGSGSGDADGNGCPALGEINDGLVAYYPFNGNANDESPYANNGTVSGAVLAADRFGKPDSAYQFDGASAYILAPDAPQQHVAAVTVSAWVRAIDAGSSGWCQEPQIVFKRNSRSSNFEGFTLRLSGGSPSYGVVGVASAGGQQVGVAGSSAVEVGRWVHLVLAADGSNVSLFQDGQLAVTVATGFPLDIGDRPLAIGFTNEWCGGHFNGVIDDIRMYNRVLTACEILALFNENPG